MNIGYDAKRAFANGTGLGHYSRTLLNSLAAGFPQHRYHLYTPKRAQLFQPPFAQQEIHLPEDFWSKQLSSLWRSAWLLKDLKRDKIDLFHGLSHELPVGMGSSSIPAVVTMHDLIFERYPKQYNWVDVQIYRRKFKSAVQQAKRIIAISQQTADDLISFYSADASKIRICYQSCNPAFGVMADDLEKQRVKHLYSLPDRFFLYVGSIIERKNLLTICHAMLLLNDVAEIPLVVIGNGDAYAQKVKRFVQENGLQNRVIFLSEKPSAQNAGFRTASDFPAIYQQALCMIYPSIFEGFGIPVLEALFARIPVITSNQSCLPEAGGPGAWYVDPFDARAMADWMRLAVHDEAARKQTIAAGLAHAARFTPEQCAAAVMNVYEELW